MTNFVGPTLLTPECVIEGFECGDALLDKWLAERAFRNHWDNSTRTWVVTVDDRVVGFYASSTAAVMHSDVKGRFRRNQPNPLPAIQLGRLAVDSKYQRQGLGKALLKHFLLKAHEVAQVTGVRLVVVHAKDNEVARFYEAFNFEPSPIDDLTLMLLVKDIDVPAP